jgi:hypothetical protein
MGILNVLKKIWDILSPKEKSEITADVKLSFFKGAKLIEINHTHKTVNIDLNKATDNQISRLGRLYPDLIEAGVIILKKKDYDTCKNYIEESKDTPILKFFRDKLNNEDFEMLRSAVFIKNSRDKGEDINNLLEQLNKKFGLRGNNICNLYCEGYFETVIKPLYSILEAKGKKDQFKIQFDEFVKDLPISYFVNSGKSQEMVNKELIGKIEKSKKYGISFLNIHGINKENKEKILEFEKLISEDKTLKTSHIREDEERISIKIDFL